MAPGASGQFQVTVTNDGTAAQYPVITVYRSGGTSASLYSIRNETTGKALMPGDALSKGVRPGDVIEVQPVLVAG